MKEKNEIHEFKMQGDMDKKRKSLLQLKQTIDHNKEVFRVKHNKNEFMNKKKLEAQNNEKVLFWVEAKTRIFIFQEGRKWKNLLLQKSKR